MRRNDRVQIDNGDVGRISEITEFEVVVTGASSQTGEYMGEIGSGLWTRKYSRKDASRCAYYDENNSWDFGWIRNGV